MVHSVRSPYDSELVDNGHGGAETYRVERTEITKHNGSTSHGHDGHLINSHEGHRHGHSIHGHKQGFQQNHRFGENAVPALVQAFSGAVGSSIANLAVHPLDLIIKRLQVQRQIQNQIRARGRPRGGLKPDSPIRRSSSSGERPGSYKQTGGRAPRPRGESPEHPVLGLGERGRNEERLRKTDDGEYSYSYRYSNTIVGGDDQARAEWRETSSEFEMEARYSGVVDAAQKIYAQEGLSGFYTGVVEETVGTLGSAFWYFAVYSYLRNKRLHKRHSNKLPVLEELLIGLAAGSVSKFFLTPFNTIATRKQTHAMLYPNARAPGIVDIYEDIMREKGITGFWSGYSASAFLSLNPSITFLLYESLKNFAGGKQRRLKGAETFLIAAVAKAIATGLTYPLAVAKSRTQIANEDDDFTLRDMANIGKAGKEIKNIISKKVRRSGNVIEVLADIFKREGIAGLYEGVLGELLRGFVSSGITMVIKESVHRTILSLYYFVMRAYNRTEDHTFHSTTKLMAKDAYDKAGPRQKKLIDKAMEGVEKVESMASHGKSKVVGLVGGGHAAGKLSEVREKITEHTSIGKHRQDSRHGGMKVAAAAAAAAAGLAAGAAHAHNRNERYDEHGNVIVHTARERVEEWREGVGEDSHHHTGKVAHSGHIADDRIHTGEMRQDVHETRTHSGGGHVGSRIGRNHNGMTEHTRIEERVEHGHSGTGSRSRRGSAVAGVVGAVTGAALGHKLSGHSHNSHGGHAAGVVGAVTGAALGHKLSGHSHNSHSSHAAGVVGAVTGATLGHKLSSHKLSSHNRNEHSHSGHAAGVTSAVTGAALGHKLSSHKLSSHNHNEHSHSGHAAGVTGAVTGAALSHKLSSHKLSSHNHNEHSHSGHGGHVAGVTGAVAGATLGHKLSKHSHSEHSHGGHTTGVASAITGAALGHKLLSHDHNQHSHDGHTHNHHGGDVITQTTTKVVEEFDIAEGSHTPLIRNHHEGHQTVTDSRARFDENSYREHTAAHESRGREHGGVAGAIVGAAERVTGHSHGRSHSGSRQGLSAGDLVRKVTGTQSHGHDHSTHGRDGQVIIHTETVKEWRDEANAVEDLRQFGVASTVHEDSRSDFGETLHKGHSIVGHGHTNRFGDDAVSHGMHGHGHTVVEKTQITRIGETLHDGGHHNHSHSHRHNDSRSNFGDATLHTDGRKIVEKTEITRIDENIHDSGHHKHGHHSHRHNHRHNDSALHADGRTIIEKTQVTRIGETSHNGHSHSAIPTRSPLGRFEDAAINKAIEKTQVTQFGEAHHDAGHHQHHRSHSSHSHGNNNSAIVGKIGHDNAVTRTTMRETEWLGKKALVNNAASINATSINTAAATAGTNGVTTVTRTEEFWPVDEDARSSVYNFLDEETKEVSGGVSVVETRTAEERWWDNKRGKGYN